MIDILLTGFDNLQPLNSSMSAEIPINEPTDKRAGAHRSKSDGKVAEANLDGIIVVGGRQLSGQTCQNDVKTGIDEAAIEEDEKALLFEKDWDGG